MVNMRITINYIILILILGHAILIYAQDEKNVTKDVTIISAQSTSDGKSEVRKEILEECILTLPNVKTLEATVTSESKYLNKINGNPKMNEYKKIYTATIEIGYLLYQKELIIITTSTIKGQKPVLKEVDRKVRQIKMFTSDPNNGDIFSGKGQRHYYFSSEENAIADVKKKASVWINQNAHTLCRK